MIKYEIHFHCLSTHIDKGSKQSQWHALCMGVGNRGARGAEAPHFFVELIVK